MSEKLNNNPNKYNDNGDTEDKKIPQFDPVAAVAARQERIEEMKNRPNEGRSGDDRYDLETALENADGYKERTQARANLAAYQEMHPDRKPEHEMYRIAKKFGNIEEHGFEKPVPDQVPEGINRQTYPQRPDEPDEQYVERLMHMLDKTNELNQLPPHQWTEKEKRRMIAQVKRARGEKVEYDENGNYKF